MYIRKTADEYQIRQYTGPQYGWEEVTSEANRAEAKKSLREYRENQPEYPVKIVKVRIKLEVV